MRNLHVVIPSIGRPSCSSVVADTLARERRLARLTIVRQGGSAVISPELKSESTRQGVELAEVVLAGPVGPAAARRRGAIDGHEEFVGFLDDDITFVGGSLSQLVDRCEQRQLGGASGVVHSHEGSLAAWLFKPLLFWSIFRDVRPWATYARRPVRSHMLSGGMVVFRRSAYNRSAGMVVEGSPEGLGEDIDLAYAISSYAALEIDPTVRVKNGSQQLSIGPANPTARALRHLERYRSFAVRHATARRHWVAYMPVLTGVLGRGLVDGARLPFVRAVTAELARAGRNIAWHPSRQSQMLM